MRSVIKLFDKNTHYIIIKIDCHSVISELFCFSLYCLFFLCSLLLRWITFSFFSFPSVGDVSLVSILLAAGAIQPMLTLLGVELPTTACFQHELGYLRVERSAAVKDLVLTWTFWEKRGLGLETAIRKSYSDFLSLFDERQRSAVYVEPHRIFV